LHRSRISLPGYRSVFLCSHRNRCCSCMSPIVGAVWLSGYSHRYDRGEYIGRACPRPSHRHIRIRWGRSYLVHIRHHKRFPRQSNPGRRWVPPPSRYSHYPTDTSDKEPEHRRYNRWWNPASLVGCGKTIHSDSCLHTARCRPDRPYARDRGRESSRRSRRIDRRCIPVQYILWVGYRCPYWSWAPEPFRPKKHDHSPTTRSSPKL